MSCNLLKELNSYPDLNLSVILLNEGKLANELRDAGLSVRVFDETSCSFVKIVWMVRAFCKDTPQDIIHAHRYKENLIAFIAAGIFPKTRPLATLHGMPEVSEVGANLGQQLKIVLNFFILSRFFVKTVAVSHDIRDYLVHQYGFRKDSVVVIHNGVPLPKYPSADTDTSPYFTIGSSGRLFPVKDYPLMVEIAKIIATQAKDVRFELAGDGPDRDEIESWIRAQGLQGSFTLRGHVDDMEAFYHGLAVYLNTSLHEGIPMTILEAMALGVPVVAPDVGGIREIIDNGIQGFLVTGRNPNDFADKCLRLLSDRNLRDAMSLAARHKAAQDFSAEKMADSYRKLYHDLQVSKVEV